MCFFVHTACTPYLSKICPALTFSEDKKQFEAILQALQLVYLRVLRAFQTVDPVMYGANKMSSILNQTCSF